MNSQQKVALELLRIGAVFLRPESPFTWASGIKSPIYCDNRLILSDVRARNYIEKVLASIIRLNYLGVEMLMGTSTAGIAHAGIAANNMGLPMGYVRSSNKNHGRQNLIEGRFEKGCKIVVVEDLISTGSSAIEVCNTLREAGADVMGIASIFTYGMEIAKDNFKANGITNYSLCDLDTILDIAITNSYIKRENKDSILKFRDNPKDESWIAVKKEA